ncbi:MAG: sugar phosphate isomerase [Lentisphaerae bacterium RIFOXYB12_FULL_65_16]|nr:MAG: sugar phosphate isomerase [Lentisphaerae bacterium RIFOXYA12_64_32]OGV86576.1 MAG: sugar phosphate isomerase [Lentisphaerae bacterium RIFOXYB12_FULL_65_16]
MYNETIRIGTLAQPKASYIKQILPHGFESFSITFWQTLGETDLKKLAREVKEVLADSSAVISSLGIYGNPLKDDDKAKETRDGWKKCIDAAHLFGCDLVCGFAGRVVDKPINESMPRFKQVFEPLAKRAADKGVRLAFENCDMGGDWTRGDWNIAMTPKCWEMMFNAVPMDNIGLEWEPCHQMVKLIDPMPQLRKWVKKIFHLHGKDATVYWDVVREHGVRGPEPFAFHRTPGFGDCNWTDIISELRRAGFKGSIDIEGWHDPVYRGELEMTGQVHGLDYLKQCRGGAYVENPQ